MSVRFLLEGRNGARCHSARRFFQERHGTAHLRPLGATKPTFAALRSKKDCEIQLQIGRVDRNPNVYPLYCTGTLVFSVIRQVNAKNVLGAMHELTEFPDRLVSLKRLTRFCGMSVLPGGWII